MRKTVQLPSGSKLMIQVISTTDYEIALSTSGPNRPQIDSSDPVSQEDAEEIASVLLEIARDLLLETDGAGRAYDDDKTAFRRIKKPNDQVN